MGILRQPSRKFILSAHARERLAERSTLGESKLLELLEHEAYRRIHVKLTPNIRQNEINLYAREYGISFKEMKRHGMVQFRVAFEHLMVWSCSDGKPLTLVVDPDNGTIITILNSDDFSRKDWSDKITASALSDVRARAERQSLPATKVYKLVVHWLDERGKPKRKTFNSPKIASVDPLIPPLDELERLARSHVANGRDVWLIVRNRKDISDIVLEKPLDETESRV